MKKLLLLLLVVPLTSFTISADSDVYICKSANAKKYHLVENCRGLSNCKALVGKVKLSEAKNQGKTICGWED
jgi:hypothetical protein